MEFLYGCSTAGSQIRGGGLVDTLIAYTVDFVSDSD